MYCHCSYNIKKKKKNALQWRIDIEDWYGNNLKSKPKTTVIFSEDFIHQSTLVALANVNLDQHDAVKLHTTQQHFEK